MIDTILFILETYGLAVAFLGVMIYFFGKSMSSHRLERAEWRSDIKQVSERYDNNQTETTAVLRELTTVIQTINNKK